MKTDHSLFIGVTLVFLLAATFLFSANVEARDRHHVYGNQYNHYYDDHNRGHRRHHHKHAKHHRHNHHDNYYPQVRRDVYYAPQYYQPPYDGYREIYYGGRNDFFMGLRSGNASIMIGY